MFLILLDLEQRCPMLAILRFADFKQVLHTADLPLIVNICFVSNFDCVICGLLGFNSCGNIVGAWQILGLATMLGDGDYYNSLTWIL